MILIESGCFSHYIESTKRHNLPLLPSITKLHSTERPSFEWFFVGYDHFYRQKNLKRSHTHMKKEIVTVSSSSSSSEKAAEKLKSDQGDRDSVEKVE